MSKASFSLFRGELIASNLPLTLKALAIAEEAHEGVIRKDGVTPYIEHPCKVASILFDLGIKSDIILSAAILHDVIEDTAVNAYDLLGKYSSMVTSQNYYNTGIAAKMPQCELIVNTVILLSKVIGNTKLPTETYYDSIKNSPEATLVKLADRVHNLSTLMSFSEEKKTAYLKETEEFVYPLIQYAQHHYYQYIDVIRILDLWIESLVNNLQPYCGQEK